MTIKKKRYSKLWKVMAIAVMLWTVGTGFCGDLSANSEETYKGLKIFTDVIDLVEKNYVDPVDPKQLIQHAIEGMIRNLDPHSTFLTPEAFKELQIDTLGELTGIGISMTMRNGFVTVISPIEGTPAYKAGIKAQDTIIKVDGKPVKDLREAVKMIRGPIGTTVVVTIMREDLAEPIDFTLVRDVIPIESVKSFVIKPGYGYIWVTNFTDKTTQDLEKALKKLEGGDIPLKGLILDLRDNPGGLLDQAISVSDLFLEEGTILSVKSRLKKNTKTFMAHADEVNRNYPLVVLINRGSASASEIVAGALQDHKRAVILGTTSFGKGSVQIVESLRDGYGLKFTIARYYTPSGRSIQAKGIDPDIVVKRRFIDDKDTDAFAEGLLKEKDLKNHLEEEPFEQKEKETESKGKKESKRKLKMHDFQYGHGPLKLENLQSDNQVMRALGILISYELFKGMQD